MRHAELTRDPTAVWEISVPPPSSRLPGVRMAGFRDRTGDLVDLHAIPYPAVTVIIDLGEGLVVEDGSGRGNRGGVIAGLAPRGVRGRGRDVECLQVRLSPLVAHAVLGASSELGGSVVALDDVWGRDAERLRERLRATGSWAERFEIAEFELGRRQEAGRAVDSEVALAWGRTTATRGRVRVEALAADLGWSRKRLWSRFRSQVGLTPKRAARLVRFDHAAHRLAAGHSVARVAAESGYADQSHLHREVMAFAGVTPIAVAAAPWLAVDGVAWGGPPPARKA